MKIFALLTSIIVLSILLTVPTQAQTLPKGLQDKGPITKMTFIHYKRENAKPDWAGGNKNNSTTTCYSYMSKGAKWKSSPEDYLINPNNSGLSTSEVTSALNKGVAAWNLEAGKTVIGNGSVDTNVVYDDSTYDDVNTVSFGNYNQASVIAVTNVWGYFSGPPSTRELVEWDMLFNTQYAFGDGSDLSSQVMDLKSIAIHELGHAYGMSHPDSTCLDETMYAYSDYNETKKRDLNSGDIEGIFNLYK